MTKGLNYKLMKQAVEGNEIAVREIMILYEPYINRLASEPLYDKDGNECIGINIDLRDSLRSKLLDVIQHYKIA